MSHYIQIFIYNAGNLINHRRNNFPLLCFESKDLAYEFISNLVSVPRDDINEEYFVINNPQLLPEEVRSLHTYRQYVVPDVSDSENEDDDDIAKQTKYIMRDGCFSIRHNLKLLASCVIDNNAIYEEDFGFNEYLAIFQHVQHIPLTNIKLSDIHMQRIKLLNNELLKTNNHEVTDTHMQLTNAVNNELLKTYNYCYYETEEYYSSQEYQDDMRQEYYDNRMHMFEDD